MRCGFSILIRTGLRITAPSPGTNGQIQEAEILPSGAPCGYRHPVSASAAIEAVLERFAHPTIPDYAGFEDWLRPQMSERDRRLASPHNTVISPSKRPRYIDSLLDLQETYQQRLKAANAQHATTGEPTDS